jgi:glutamyl-tRNA reductase
VRRNLCLRQTFIKPILRDSKTKLIVDLAIPADVDATVCKAYPVHYISVETLKEISDKNLLLRRQELLKVRQLIFSALEDFKAIFEMRQVEIKMQAIPTHVKAIRQKAMEEVFSKEVEELDEKSKEILHKILNYMEKKYVSVPMIMAKENAHKNKLVPKMELIIGSRGSDLALWQANFVKASLEQLGHSVSIKIILTKGDKIQNLSFDKLEGKGFFYQRN